MKYPISLGLAALVVSACGQRAAETVPNSNAVQTTQLTQTYSGTGTVTAITGDQVTIAHGPIEGIAWPAMTMSFTAPEGLAERVEVGSDVSFAFHQRDGTYVLSRLEKR